MYWPASIHLNLDCIHKVCIYVYFWMVIHCVFMPLCVPDSLFWKECTAVLTTCTFRVMVCMCVHRHSLSIVHISMLTLRALFRDLFQKRSAAYSIVCMYVCIYNDLNLVAHKRFKYL